MKDPQTPPACAAPSDPARQIESPIEAALDRLARVLNMWEATTGEPLSHSEIDAARAELAVLHAERESLRDALKYCLRELRHTRKHGPWPDAKYIAEAALVGDWFRYVESEQLTADGREIVARNAGRGCDNAG